MEQLSLVNITKSIQSTIQKHSPEILTGIGIAGMITTAVMAVRATPKALMLIEEKKKEDELDELTLVEIIKATWTCYIPVFAIGGLSVICLIGASGVNVRRNAALATAFSLSESALKEYQGKVVETIGQKKEQTVKDAIAKDKLDKDPVSNKEIIITQSGNTLCYDVISGRYFKSDIDKLQSVANELNRNMLGEMYISLNDFYYEIGLTSTKLGDDLGWKIDDGFINFNFSSQLADDKTPCLVIDYNITPKYNYRK